MPADPLSTSDMHMLYAGHRDWLQAWLRRRLGNAWDASDLTHDTFLRLLTRSEPMALREPRAMLTTVAKGVLSNFRRRCRIEAAYREALASLPEPSVPDVETQMLWLEALVELDRRLDTLGARARQAFLLAQLDELTQPDIAQRLGVSLATVQRDLAKAAHLCFFGA